MGEQCQKGVKMLASSCFGKGVSYSVGTPMIRQGRLSDTKDLDRDGM